MFSSKTALYLSIASLGVMSVRTQAQVPAQAAPQNSKALLDLKADIKTQVTATSEQVSLKKDRDGLDVTIAPGPEGYPGLNIKPAGAASWDLSKFGHVEARLVNTGAKEITLNLRVDNGGDWRDNPWNTESVQLKPGESKIVSTIFGFAYGNKPGYALKPEAVVNLLLFTNNVKEAASFRIESVVAAGPAGEKPPIDPNSIRIKPKDGFLFGNGVPIEPTQITGNGGFDRETGTWGFALMRTKGAQETTLKPLQGRWDLRDFLEVRVKMKNGGLDPITPRVRLSSNSGTSNWFSTSTPLAPGATAEIIVPFDNGNSINLADKATMNRVASNTVSGVTIATDDNRHNYLLRIESVQAVMPPAPALPDWLGKRPPVDGNWVQTLDENFDGEAVNDKVWNIYAENYWDKLSHMSRDNIWVKDGFATLHHEKKRGHDWDDPNRKETDYATGYLDSYGKWTQCYGYFEARMKLPTAPGLWPAFWMMPERGVAAGPEQWKRADTKNGGMEFDIMEHLTGWGRNRYNVAQHWDGYDKEHQNIGTDKLYLQPDKEGFITCGLLWQPGSVVYYGNGKELARWQSERVSNVPSNFIFDLVTGGWDNVPLDDKQLPADFVVDYVRAWQLKERLTP